jgi:pimeloyl-ACP methyl ester carboxylesterase
MPKLLSYIAERKRRAARWEGALVKTAQPLALVWGPEDPVSGAHILAWARATVPRAVVTVLAGIGHYPMIEDPDAVVTAIDAFARRSR